MGKVLLTESSDAQILAMKMILQAFIILARVRLRTLRMLTFIYQLETVVRTLLFAFQESPIELTLHTFRIFNFYVCSTIHKRNLLFRFNLKHLKKKFTHLINNCNFSSILEIEIFKSIFCLIFLIYLYRYK